LACDIGVKKNPSDERGPKARTEIRQPKIAMMAGVRQDILCEDILCEDIVCEDIVCEGIPGECIPGGDIAGRMGSVADIIVLLLDPAAPATHM